MAKSRKGWKHEGIDWVVNHEEWGRVKPDKGNEKNRPEKTDRKLKYCIKCERVWEYTKYNNKLTHYDDFPSYGKIREMCGECR